MKPHLTDEAVVDLATGAGEPSERAHAASCAECAARVRESLDALDLARQAEVPEPSPLYWQALRNGVSRRIAEEGREKHRFGFLVPLAAAAGLVAVVLSLRAWQAPPARPVGQAQLPAWSALPLEEEDAELSVLEGVALASSEAGEWPDANGLQGYVASLSDDEALALAESLRQGQGGES
jgi:hypothetical protein